MIEWILQFAGESRVVLEPIAFNRSDSIAVQTSAGNERNHRASETNSPCSNYLHTISVGLLQLKKLREILEGIRFN